MPSTRPGPPARDRRRRASARPRSVVAAAATALLLLAGCGADGSGSDAASTTTKPAPATSTSTAEATTTTAEPATTAPPTTVAPTPPETATTVPGGPGDGSGTGGGQAAPLTAEQAAAEIRSTGAWDPDLGTYDPRAQLSGVIGTAAGSGSAAAPQQLFLFSYGQYLGTATSTPRAGISIDVGESGAVQASYGHWAEADPFCCPSLAPWQVTFRIGSDGEVVPEGELPPEDQFG